MTIQEMLKNKFDGNQSVFRLLSDHSNSGYLSMGYVEKSTVEGTNVDLSMDHYDGVWILSGTGVYRDKNNEEITLSAGDFVQRLPNNTHSTIVTSDDWKEFYISVGIDLYNLLKEINVVDNESPVLHPGTDFELLETFLYFYDALKKKQPPHWSCRCLPIKPFKLLHGFTICIRFRMLLPLNP